jgi:hypothetical protein
LQLVPFCDVDVRFTLPYSLLQTRGNVVDITQIGISGATLNSTKTVLVVSDLKNKLRVALQWRHQFGLSHGEVEYEQVEATL